MSDFSLAFTKSATHSLIQTSGTEIPETLDVKTAASDLLPVCASTSAANKIANPEMCEVEARRR